ncbi:D-aminoacyl-tRNA deacylase 1 (DTD) (DNA-unwinding element-binding protein B) (DUE-B) (Gly-tRNA(Ala) deacylase) (Histidyl-tRNA synthase-related) [Durusdinium trenchii]|uniref:D-aminoacyl-tRNA deacylase n=1 Tax=Durusdinium trenchii TaxID=1381693 RepID=A0ABP0PJC1_9DINO
MRAFSSARDQVVSQFTLFATFKGLKPNFNRALPGSEAEAIYESFVGSCRELLGDSHVGTGAFGEMMQLELCNDGPVTVELETPRSAVRGTRHRRTQRRRRPFCLAGAGFFLGRQGKQLCALAASLQSPAGGAAWCRLAEARFSAPVQAQTDYPGQFQGWVPVDERGYVLTDWARQEAEHLEARPQRQVFHANRREPGYEGVDMLNQAHLMSLSSISPQTSQLQPMDQGSARSDDSGILPQRPERRVVTRPASVPKLDLTQMQQLLEEEDYEEAEQEDEDGQYDDEHQPPGAGGLHDESDDGGRPPSE